jgi:hypothetical protein
MREVYQKPGASQEDLRRTGAACMMKAEMAQSSSTDPNPYARAGTYVFVLRTCMAAEGYALVRVPN